MKAPIKGYKKTVRKYGHEPLIAPLAYFKKTIQAVYELLLNTLFLTSTGKQNFDDGAHGILFILSFIILCIIAFYLKEREILIFLLFFVIFVIDKYSSKHHYLYLDPQKETLLKVRGEVTFFEEFFKGKPFRREKFSSSILSHISIDRQELSGGAFQERLDVVWRVCLHLFDQSPIVFHHSQEIAEAYGKAIEIANSYSSPKPILFANSLGFGECVLMQFEDQERIFYINRCRHTVQFDNQLLDEWVIRSCWSFENYFRMFLEILKVILISLSLVLIVNLMSEFGEIFIEISQKAPLTEIVKSMRSVGTVFSPSSNLTEFSEIVAISLVMLSKQLNISRVEEIIVSKYSLQYYLGKKLLGKLDTQNIKSVFLIEDPEPVIYIADQNQFIEIPGLQTKEEFKAFLCRIIESVECFQRA